MSCESCGDANGDLASVQRIYLVEGEDGGERTSVLDGIERWCFPCRSLYPHRAVVEDCPGDDPPPRGGA